MKVQVTTYSFDKTAGTVTFDSYSSINLDSILLITNVKSNIIIYNFADSANGGTVSPGSNVLTLMHDTTAMADNDALQIFYEDRNITAATNEQIILLNETLTLFRQMRKLLESNAVVDSQMRQRISVDNTVAISGAVTTVTSLSQYAGVDARWQMLDIARNAYANSIRNHLTF